MMQQYPSRQIDSEKEKYWNKLFPATVNKRKWKEKLFRKFNSLAECCWNHPQ